MKNAILPSDSFEASSFSGYLHTKRSEFKPAQDCKLESLLLKKFGCELETAKRLTYTLVAEFWKHSVNNLLRLRGPAVFGLKISGCDEATQSLLANRAAQLVLLNLDVASFEIGRFYMNLLPQDYRSGNGIYYTPPALVTRLLDTIEERGIEWKTAKVLDPACGGGAFVAPVIARKILASKRLAPRKCVRQIGESVKGIELDPFAAWLSQVFADLSAAPLCRAAGEPLPVVVEVADALKPRPREEGIFDLVVGNPPYTRVSPDPTTRERYRRSLYGHANLYGMFTDQALRFARKGGSVAFVTPTSFLGGQYFQNLRGLLRTEASPRQLDFVTERNGVFDGVQQETMLALYQKGYDSRTVCVGSIEARANEVRHRRIGRFMLPDEQQGAWILPRTEDQKLLVTAATHLRHKLRDYGYEVNTGPLVWNRFKPQLKSEPGKNRFPLVWAESVSSDCQFFFRAQKQNHEPYFEWRGERDDWLVVRTSCVLVQRTTAKEQARRLISAVLPKAFIGRSSGVVVENHLNMVRPLTSEPKVSIEAIAAVLRSRSADVLFRCISGSVAVSAYELEHLPLPGAACFADVEIAMKRGASEQAIQAIIESHYIQSSHAAAP